MHDDVASANSDQLARLSALEDQESIRDTIYQYCHSLDYGLENEFVDCFMSDAEWVWTVRDPMLQASIPYAEIPIGDRLGVPTPHVAATAAAGTEQLRQLVRQHTRPPGRWHKHCVMNTRIEIVGDGAHAISYFVRVDAAVDTNSGFVRAFGRYHDDLVRCDDGKWRIARRYTQLEHHSDA